MASMASIPLWPEGCSEVVLTLEPSGKIFKVPEVEAVPMALVAVTLRRPEFFTRASLISSRTNPKSTEGMNFVPLGKGFSLSSQSVF